MCNLYNHACDIRSAVLQMPSSRKSGITLPPLLRPVRSRRLTVQNTHPITRPLIISCRGAAPRASAASPSRARRGPDQTAHHQPNLDLKSSGQDRRRRQTGLALRSQLTRISAVLMWAAARAAELGGSCSAQRLSVSGDGSRRLTTAHGDSGNSRRLSTNSAPTHGDSGDSRRLTAAHGGSAATPATQHRLTTTHGDSWRLTAAQRRRLLTRRMPSAPAVG